MTFNDAADRARDQMALRIVDLSKALLVATELVRGSAPLAWAAAGDTDGAYRWELQAEAWLAEADAILTGTR